MQADVLAGLLRELGLAPAVIFGGSGGARVSLLAAARHPDIASRLAMVWICGGVYGLMLLAVHYCGESIRAAWGGGMESVAELPEWSEVIERNPGTGNASSISIHGSSSAPSSSGCSPTALTRHTVPGLPDALGARFGASHPCLPEWHHRRPPHPGDLRTGGRTHPGSRLVAPPWGDDEWNERGEAARNGTGHLFERWPLLVPQLLEFAGDG